MSMSGKWSNEMESKWTIFHSHVTSYKIYKRLLFIFNHTWDDWLRWQTYWHTVLFGWLKNHQKKDFLRTCWAKTRPTPWEKPPPRSLWNHHVARIWCRASSRGRCPSVPCLFVIRAPSESHMSKAAVFWRRSEDIWSLNMKDMEDMELWVWWILMDLIAAISMSKWTGQVLLTLQFLCWKHELKTG